MRPSPPATEPAFSYRWFWSFRAPPERVWPLVSDTQRFNEATGLPPAQPVAADGAADNGRRVLRFRRFGLSIAWDEYPFEWVQPRYFGVLRVYHTGPVAWMRVHVQLDALPDGGTHLTYEIRIHPANPLGYIAIPVQIKWLSRRAFDRVFRRIDEALQEETPFLDPFPLPVNPLSPAAEARIGAVTGQLADAGHRAELIERLVRFIREAPDADLVRMRPFALADAWNADRFQVLALCLHAARLGLLDVSWDLLCPECRGAPSTAPTLANLQRHAHCPSCNIDYEVDFDHNIEVTFHPNASVKRVEQTIFCVGGPQNTPHIVAQQVLTPQERRMCELPMATGHYRIRGPRIPGRPTVVEVGGEPGGATARSHIVIEKDGGKQAFEVVIDPEGLHPSEEKLRAGALAATFENRTALDQVVVVEQTAWSDQAATAAQVTTLQAFRDLFSSEALRPMEQIAVTSLTILFTDLKGSTAIYRQVGDAPAFRRVMNHFTILKDSVTRHHGSIVKTIGDAIMAVFTDPAEGLAAGLDMLAGIAASNAAGDNPFLTLKVGLHRGPCIAVNQNDRLDYFGSTVNLASRIEAQSNGDDAVISDAVLADPGVRAWLAGAGLSAAPFTAELKGFREPIQLYRVMPNG
jgi:class 3 adenylate cyclase